MAHKKEKKRKKKVKKKKKEIFRLMSAFQFLRIYMSMIFMKLQVEFILRKGNWTVKRWILTS